MFSIGPEKYNKLTLALILFVVTILIFLLDIVGFLGFVHDGWDYITKPVVYAVTEVRKRWSYTISSIGHITQLKEENIELRKQIIDLETEVIDLENLKSEQIALKEQLTSLVGQVDKAVQARVISSNPSGYNGYILVDKGTVDGLAKDQYVVYGKYFVGKVAEVRKRSALVSTLYSGLYSLPVKVNRDNKIHGVIRGEVDGLILEGVSQTVKIKKKDQLLSWGSDIPLDIYIGRIEKVTSNPSDSTQKAKVSLPLDYSALDYLYIITKW